MAFITNEIVVQAPIEDVWRTMNDLERWPDLFTEYASIEILERQGATVRFRLTTHPDPESDGKVWSWVSERTADHESYTSHARRVETGPFEFMKIDWTFAPLPEGTLMRWEQRFRMKPDAPADDQQATDYLNRNTRIQMGVIKERLEAALQPAG